MGLSPNFTSNIKPIQMRSLTSIAPEIMISGEIEVNSLEFA